MKEHDDYTDELLEALKSELIEQKGNVVRLSMPHFLYQTTKQAQAYEKATYKSDAYLDKLDKPISKLIEDNIVGLCDEIGKKIHFIDLGPGYPSKSLKIIDAMKERGCNITYFPVDVSLFFLNRATSAVASRDINSNQLQERFEDLAPVLDKDLFLGEGMRYIFLGLTFNNFEPSYICRILADLTNDADRCVICCQSPAGLTKKELIQPYLTKSVDEFCFLPLALLGLEREDFKFNVVYQDNAIRVQYGAVRNISIDGVLIPKGLMLETSASYRYELDDVLKSVKEYFSVQAIFNSELEHIYLLSLKSEKKSQ